MIQHLEILLYSDMAYTEYFPYPTYWQLDRIDQIHYDQNGFIQPLNLDLYTSRYSSKSFNYYHPGSGIWECGSDRLRFEEIFDADLCTRDLRGGDRILFLVYMDYGVMYIESFVENYLLEVDPEYREKILRQLTKHNLNVSIVGERQFINIIKDKK